MRKVQATRANEAASIAYEVASRANEVASRDMQNPLNANEEVTNLY